MWRAITIASHNLLNVKNRNTKKRYERFTKLTIKTPEIVCACRIWNIQGRSRKNKEFQRAVIELSGVSRGEVFFCPEFPRVK